MKALERPWVLLLLLALATAVLLHANLAAPFFRLDDSRYVRYAVEGPWTRLLRPQRGMVFAPLTYFSFRLDRLLFGPAQENVKDSFGDQVQERTGDPIENPKSKIQNPKSWAYGPRLMNGLQHLWAGFFLWLFLLRLRGGGLTPVSGCLEIGCLSPSAAAFVALAWAVHPLALESVAWVCERKNTLCAMFGFASLAAWTAPRGKAWRVPLVWLLFAAAIFSKVAALSLVPLFVALEFAGLTGTDTDAPETLRPLWNWLPVPVPRWDGQQWLGVIRRLSGQLIVSAFAVVLGMRVFEYDIAMPPGGSAWTGLLTDTDIFWRYTRNLLLPLNLSFFYGVKPVLSLADPRLLLLGGGLALFWAAMLWQAGPRWRWLALIGFVWFFGGLGPNANLIATAFPMQDRYLYLPGPGLFLALCAALKGLAGRSGLMERALPFGGAAYVVLLAASCALRSPLFADSTALELDAARRQPDSGLARWSATIIRRERFLEHANSANESELRQSPDDAEKLIREGRAALSCRDTWDFTDPLTVRVYMAEALLYLGRDAEARDTLEAAMPPPGPLPGWRDVGRIFKELPPARQQRVSSTYFRQSVAKANVLLGELSLRQSYFVPALDERLARAREAVVCADRSLAVHPLHDEAPLLKGKALLHIAYLHAHGGDMDNARKVYEEAKTILSKLAASSPQSAAAKRLLEKVPPLEAPR